MNNIPFKYSIIFASMKSIDINYHIPERLDCILLEKETKHYYQDSKEKIAHNEKRSIQLLCLPVIRTNCLMAITVDIIKMTLHTPSQDCKPLSHSTAKLLSARAYSKDIIQFQFNSKFISFSTEGIKGIQCLHNV